tara:strand:- start:168 stop:623 length:456 start_codon:yes stop_codon:yes gene_type:complete
MQKLTEKFEVILTNFDKSINSNIFGLNYLELLKIELIEKLNTTETNFFNDLKKDIKDKKNITNSLKLDNKTISYGFHFYEKSLSTIKQKEKSDQLIIVLEGLDSVTIYDKNNLNKNIFSDLTKNMGLTVSVDTFTTSKITDKSIILSISFN